MRVSREIECKSSPDEWRALGALPLGFLLKMTYSWLKDMSLKELSSDSGPNRTEIAKFSFDSNTPDTIKIECDITGGVRTVSREALDEFMSDPNQRTTTSHVCLHRWTTQEGDDQAFIWWIDGGDLEVPLTELQQFWDEVNSSFSEV